jgi:hypothetical protein
MDRLNRPERKRRIFFLLIILAIISLATGYMLSGNKLIRLWRDIPPPDLKLPLPGIRSWLLTVEAGGKAFRGSDDPYHKGGSHFALDFDDLTLEDGPLTDVPVLAAGDGKVLDSCKSIICRFSGSGYSVLIDHNEPYDGSGYVTLYGHLKKPPKVSEGDMVKQGDILGIVGSTGLSNGTHLHFRIYAFGENDESVKELKELKLDGRLINDYKVNPKGDSLSTYKYYRSTNVNPDVVLKKRE